MGSTTRRRRAEALTAPVVQHLPRQHLAPSSLVDGVVNSDHAARRRRCQRSPALLPRNNADLAMSSSRGLQPLRRMALKNICSDGYTHVPPAQKLVAQAPASRTWRAHAHTPGPPAWCAGLESPMGMLERVRVVGSGTLCAASRTQNCAQNGCGTASTHRWFGAARCEADSIWFALFTTPGAAQACGTPSAGFGSRLVHHICATQ